MPDNTTFELAGPDPAEVLHRVFGHPGFRGRQEEIIRHTDDHTIFLWRGVEDGHPGLLARDPAAFAETGDAYSSQSDEDRTQPVRRDDSPAPRLAVS